MMGNIDAGGEADRGEAWASVFCIFMFCWVSWNGLERSAKVIGVEGLSRVVGIGAMAGASGPRQARARCRRGP